MAPSLAVANGRVLAPAGPLAEFERDVHHGLSKTQKELPAKYLYDAVGSALFDAITYLPEYGLTRAEERLIHAHAKEAAWRIGRDVTVAELGSGCGRKTRPILEAIARRQGSMTYCAIDLSKTALKDCRQQLAGLESVRVRSIERSYLDGLKAFVERRPRTGRVLVLFLGSSIGNFSKSEAAEFLKSIRSCLRPGDALMLGTDLIKSAGQLVLAYDDAAGVTAAFNRNVLLRINRELGANFQARQFRHEARWCPAAARVEMHLVSELRQSVTIGASCAEVHLEEGESIWTESSYKFDPAELPLLAERTGFVSADRWIDREWPFAENLWLVPD